ncbi:MAG: hypothetical protein KJP15_00760 [Gammaproteobacteria bacterium]|nr:hypothetical protein [Gammaproteobacteria bacterium]
MTDKLPISNELLLRLAGKPAFNRGMDYFQGGRVRGLRQHRNKITAEVEGTETYQVTLKWTSKQLDGACDCPASEGFDFCKHCVAVALTLRETQAQQDQLMKGGPENRIKAYLLKQDKDKLATWLLELIESDRALSQQWSLRADRALGVLDAKALKKNITAAIPYNRNLYRYNQVRSYFAQVETILEQLCDLTDQLPAADTLKLVDYALQRIWRALDTIDDSGGFRYGSVELLQTTHIQACQRLDWPKQKLAEYLLEIAFDNASDLYPEIPLSYTNALGDSGLALFYDAVQAKWDALPALKQGAGFDQKCPYFRLEHMLEQRARLDNDISTLIKLKQKTATNLRDYQELAELCLQADDFEAVEAWLAKCRLIRETDYQQRTDRIQVSLFKAKAMWPDALDRQWRIYAKDFNLDDYLVLLEIAQSAGDERDWRETAIQRLQQQARTNKKSLYAPWNNKLLEFYLHDGAIDQALAIATNEKVSAELVLELAWKVSNEPDKAFPLFQRVVEHSIRQTKNTAYRDAIKLLQEMAGVMKSRQQQQQMQQLLAYLRQEYRAKRNFIKYLNEAF